MLHSKFWQAFFAIAPLFIFFILFSLYALFLIQILGHASETGGDMENMPFSAIAPIGGLFLLMLGVFTSLASLVFYIVHAVQNPKLQESNLLVVWIILFIFVGGISQFLYWIIEILNNREQSVQP